MRKILCSLLCSFIAILPVLGQKQVISVKSSSNGHKIDINGKDFFINGMNWDYFPIGTNFSYSLWKQPEEVIKSALDYEMPMLQNMGVNTIRQYTGVPAKWIEYIYDNYGIYTMLNHSFGRYGLTLNGKWEVNTDYSNPLVRDLLLKEVKQMVEDYKNTRGVLLFLLGNENNYGLFWRGAETEDIPMQDRKSTVAAGHMYKLFNEAVVAMKAIDQSRPISICNGDLLFLDVIAKECKDVDILGINIYRGLSFGDAYDRVAKEYGKPVVLTEFGSDAYDAMNNQEAQEAQAKFLVSNWKEIYENAAGKGKAGNSLGGFTFQFSDGWWKTGQTTNLDVHDVDASWSNGGYSFDYKAGENNMNEEWFGICAKGQTNERGTYELYPRAAYYALKEAHKFDPYASATIPVSDYMLNIGFTDAMLRARGDKAALESKDKGKLYLSDLQVNFNTYSTGGSLISTPAADEPAPINPNVYPTRLGFDHMQSVFFGATAKPTSNVTANVQFNVLGNVAVNPIDEIFYENRGRPISVMTTGGTVEEIQPNRIQLYRASFDWNAKLFRIKGFYRTSHYHWGYEGDFFGLYQEANYGPNIDIYNGMAPFGFEIEGKAALKGLKVAFGPELWWGANPSVMLKYTRKIANFDVTGIFHEDITQRENSQSSFAVPMPKTRRGALTVSRKFGNFGMDLGGLWAGQPLNGRTFQLMRDDKVYQDVIKSEDNFGGKAKFTYLGGVFKWYGQGTYRGLVANGGPDVTQTITGWRLKDHGIGNTMNFLTGFAINTGNFQIAPNFMWQKPIEGPIPFGMAAPAAPRNILDDPFSVRSNRETVGGELLLTFDPTPGTWMYEWDNDRAEDAKFAMSVDFVYRHLPTIQDAAIGILANGRTFFAFPGSAPAEDLWEVNSRIVSKVNPLLGFVFNGYIGNGQANGSNPRLIQRSGFDIRTIYKQTKFVTMAKFNDWGPFDYHRDFNLTFPVQLMADISTEVGKPDWFILPSTKIGIRGTYRTLDQYSNRYAPVKTQSPSGEWIPDPTAIGFPNGNEWEIRTYIQINLGK